MDDKKFSISIGMVLFFIAITIFLVSFNILWWKKSSVQSVQLKEYQKKEMLRQENLKKATLDAIAQWQQEWKDTNALEEAIDMTLLADHKFLLEKLDSLLQNTTSCAILYYWRAVLLQKENKFQKAFDDFNKYLSLVPDSVHALVYRGKIFLKADEIEYAKQDFQHALLLDSDLELSNEILEKIPDLQNQKDIDKDSDLQNQENVEKIPDLQNQKEPK